MPLTREGEMHSEDRHHGKKAVRRMNVAIKVLVSKALMDFFLYNLELTIRHPSRHHRLQHSSLGAVA